MLRLLALSLALLAMQSAPEKTMHAAGSFDIQLHPGPTDKGISHLSSDKQFHGGIEGTSYGEMLYSGSATQGGYVALEVVNGKVNGRTGTFVLEHKGTAEPGKQEMDITVVPGSGTGELAGMSGKLTITIKDKQHFYDFEYTLPEAK